MRPDPALEKEWNERHCAAPRRPESPGGEWQRNMAREWKSSWPSSTDGKRNSSAPGRLGLAPTAEAIAPPATAGECHPDHGGSQAEMIRVNDAYSRLIDRADRGRADPPSASATAPLPR